jgi:hypothetical protein
VGLVTEQFRGLAEATARGRRNPELAIVVLPAGFDELPESEIRAQARARLPQLIRALLGA